MDRIVVVSCLLLLLMAGVSVQAQTNTNFVKETVINVPGITSPAASDALPIGSKNETTTYFDGLGRPIQVVKVQQSPTQLDIVQPISYDKFGRERFQYLLYSYGNDGLYKPEALRTANAEGTDEQQYVTGQQYNFYQTGGDLPTDNRPFAETRFESSPLNRILEQAGPGEAWASDQNDAYSSTDRTIKTSYETNGSSEVLLFKYIVPTGNYPIGLIQTGTTSPEYYGEYQLYKTRTKDEQHHEVIEYKDKEGRVVLKRVQAVEGTPVINDTNYASTYYVYDDFGSLVCVIQPEGAKRLAAEYYQSAATLVTKDAFLNRFAFRYAYDARRRMTHKQVPGADMVFMVYDNRDRLVLTQDGNQRPTRNWLFTKYDLLNRPVMTGIKDTTVTLTQAQMQDAVNGYYLKTTARWGESLNGTVHGYTNRTYPLVKDLNKYLTVTYYDDYTFKAQFYDNVRFDFRDSELPGEQETSCNTHVLGQVVGARIRVIDNGLAGSFTWLNSVIYYDGKHRAIQTISENYKGGEDCVTNVYDFPGKVTKSKSTISTRNVTWTDRLNVYEGGNKLLNTNPTAVWNTAGAASVERLAAEQDGWVEVMMSELDLNRIIGFSDVNTNADITTIDYGMVLVGDQLRAYTNGTSRKTVSGMKSGDIFRLERIGSTIQSKINGSLFYTYPAPSTGSLLVDVAFRTPSSSMAGVRTSFTIKSQSIVKTYSYDHAGRLLTTRHKLTDGQEIVLSSNIYNEAGQLIDKKLHSDDNGSSYSQSVDYRYNIRGWLTKINESDLTAQEPGDAADLFGMELAYDKDLSTGNASDLQFSGNISAIKWNKDLGQGTVKENAYNYSYDPMNRIKGAAFKEYINSWSDANGQSFSESSYLYDLNGNIQQLTRKGENGSPMDILAYDYGTASTYGNKLLKVADTGDKYKGFVDGANTGNDYTYDLSGNMLTDQNKGITANIVYNYMNLPEIVTRGANGIRFIYDATGKRIGKYAVFVKESTHTENIGDFEYEGGVVKTVYHDEGRIVFGEEKLVYKHDGSSTDDITASTASLALVTSASSETYVRATSSGTSTLQGIFPIGQAIPVAQGERYKVRVKAYRGTSGAFILVKVNGVNMNWPGAALPATVSGEAWTEHLVTIPVNGTSMEVGVKWVNVANGEQIFLNELEVIKLEQSAPEYQYSLKDHLGNVRLTFTTKQEVETTTATLEFDVEDEDRSNYLRYDMAKRVNSRLFDHTHADSTGYAVRLNGLEDERVGLAKSLSVMPGDTIRAKVYAKYVDTNTGNLSTALTTLLTQVSQGTAGVVVDGPGYPTSSSTPLGIGAIDHGDDDTGEAPMAYLNCVFINRKYDTNSIRAKAVRMSDAGKETGGTAEGVAHQLLMLTDTIKEPGYVYIYLSNDNLALRGQQVEVYFDDFEVTQAKSPVVQADDYYPFGFTFNSYQRENSVQNKFKFQGQEHVDDLDLGWDSFKWRNHQPDIGRFFNVDPLAEKYYYNSPYAFSENKVTSHVELEGLEAQDIKRQITDKNNWEELGRGVKQFGGELLKNTGLKAVWNAITALEGSIPHEDDKPRDVAGPTVTIVDSQVGPNSENLPNAEDASNNYIIDKSLLDALFAIPGRKYDGTTPRTAPGAPSKVDPEVGEKVAEVAGGVADAVSAGKEVFKPKVPDYVTQDSTLWIVGQDSTWRKN